MNKICRFIWIVVAVVALAGLCVAEIPAEAIVGKWSSSEFTICFYGQGIGREITSGASRYFLYEAPSESVMVFSYGGGESATYSFIVSAEELRLTATNGIETVYAKVRGFTNSCSIIRRRLEGAIALYTVDHEDSGPMMMEDLVPAYLPEAQACPEGGSYVLGPPPMCSLVEHLPQDDD